MSRKFITDEDLKNFSLDNYADLKGFSYADWLGLVFHRSALWEISRAWEGVKTGQSAPEPNNLIRKLERATNRTAPSPEVVSESLTLQMRAAAMALVNSPIDRHSFTFPVASSVDVNNPLATPTIRLRSQPYRGSAPSVSDDFNAGLFGTIDGVPLAQAYEATTSPRRVLLEVDIDSDNAQLINDFRSWLRTWRAVTRSDQIGIGHTKVPDWMQTTIDRWVKSHLVPYIDLKLIARFLRRNFRAGQLMDRVCRDSEKRGPGNSAVQQTAEKKLKRLVNDFFSDATFDMLYFHSFHKARSTPKNGG